MAMNNAVLRSLGLKAKLLPDPFAPESRAFAASPPNSPWRALVHFGTRHALRVKQEDGELLNDSLTLLKVLNIIWYEAGSPDLHGAAVAERPMLATPSLKRRLQSSPWRHAEEEEAALFDEIVAAMVRASEDAQQPATPSLTRRAQSSPWLHAEEEEAALLRDELVARRQHL